jgi:TP901 family phage tail tape measure protein
MSNFVAEASVLIRPDTSKFRAELIAELTAASKGVAVTIPVAVAGGSASAARATEEVRRQTEAVTKSVEKQVAAQEASAAQARKADVDRAASAAASTRAEGLYAAALARTAALQKAGVAAVTEAAAARARYQAAISANVAADRAWRAAVVSGNTALVQTTASLLAKTAATERDTLAALRNAQASATQASAAQASDAATRTRERFAARGAVATVLSLIGVRGATLAANSAFLAGAAAAVAFAKSLQSAARLETQFNVFRVTAQATEAELRQVSETARELGRDITLPGVTAADAAEAMTELAKAGLDVQDSVAGARGVLQLATAAQIDNAQATEIVAGALNAFGRGGSEAVKVADLLANASIAAQGSISDMAQALTQSSAVARQFGVSLEDTVALITLLARNGIRGSDAGTSLRTALLRLGAPTDKARELLGDLNVQIRDLQGNIRPEVFAELGVALSRLSPAQSARATRDIFGQDAIRAFSIFAREGADGLDDMRVAAERVGTASEIAGARTSGLAGSVENLKNQVESLGTSLGRAATPAVKGFVDNISFLIGKANEGADALGRLRGRAEEFADQQLPDFLAPLREAQVSALEQLNPFLPLTERVERFKEALDIVFGTQVGLTEQMKKARVEADALAAALAAQPRSDVQFNLTVTSLDKMAEKFAKAGPEGRRFADEIRNLAAALRAANQDSDTFQGPDFAKAIETARQGAKDVTTAAVDQFGNDLPFWFNAGQDATNALADGISSGVVNVAAAARRASSQAIKELEGQVAGFQERQNRARAAGDRAGELEALRGEATRLQRIIDRAGPDAEGRLLKDRREAQAQLAGVNSQIRSIEAQIASEAEAAQRDRERAAKDAKDRIQRAKDDADKAFVDAISVRESQLDVAAIRAQTTPALRDDIRAAVAIRNYLRGRVKAVRAAINDPALEKSLIADLKRKIAEKDKEIQDLYEELTDRIKERKARRQALKDESLQLDVDIASATGNKEAEIRARERQLAETRRKHAKAKGIERKRLLLELRREEAELRELRGEAEKRNRAAQELAFEFLTAQQGFAANLLGNLIPGGATGGLVGGGSSAPTAGVTVPKVGPLSDDPALGSFAAAQRDISDRGAVADGRAQPTAGQMATLIQLTGVMVEVLKDLKRGVGHPEAKRSAVTQKTSMDMIHY